MLDMLQIGIRLNVFQKYKFFTINDNCHALGAKYKKDKKYACKFADIVTQSFDPVKVITTGEAGSSTHKL